MGEEMTTPLTPCEIKALEFLREWGLDTQFLDSDWPGEKRTNGPLVWALALALGEAEERGYTAGLEAPRNPGR